MFPSSRLKLFLAVSGLALVGTAALPNKAEAWWRGGWCCGVHVGVVLPPLVVAPPPVYVAPPAYYYRPPVAYYPGGPVWIRPHWQGGYWIPGHWA